MSAAKTLRALLARSDMLVAPGGYDGMTARLIEQAGFSAIYMTGAGTAAAHGFPDYGLLTGSEMADNAAYMAAATSLPIIADADTGYGNELNVTRTVRDFERAGVAAIHIEDQVAPKKCGHLDDKQIIPSDMFVGKIAAAVAAKRDPDFMIIGRTDARAVAGFDEAVARANAALEAGADMIFLEATQTIEEMAAVPARVNGPCLLNVVPGGKTPSVTYDEAEAMGYRLAICPGVLLRAVVPAIDEALAALKRDRLQMANPDGDVPVAESFRRFGAGEWDVLRRTYAEG
ncbi:carboxyvinyl-carboxyphosphonate phosphorylmutase [Tsuneonella suprasediminis]|uniref:Carboxyvinyl-carboxyphosphonate phosphorylmutase n=1 Tax=Tsuneonella suprasediminis TaxID=2306996 RepID=A0A419R3M7_9SPHN|nr:isocitrate lyase/PEP mutase family protein [Tsuneonella suprasediminis]RJX69124.1 carboxyvinyl-carboxyphosphonate phosphorylmutase [Tsuneonella suprasediminis]